MNQAFLGYASGVLVIANVGFAAFVAAAPSGALPWWAVAAFAAVNAAVHALPSAGISVTGAKPEAQKP